MTKEHRDAMFGFVFTAVSHYCRTYAESNGLDHNGEDALRAGIMAALASEIKDDALTEWSMDKVVPMPPEWRDAILESGIAQLKALDEKAKE